MPATSKSMTVPLTTLTATDNVAVTGYLIVESAAAPAAGATGWSAGKPAGGEGLGSVPLDPNFRLERGLAYHQPLYP